MEEIWKDMVGYESLYQISNLGNVKCLPKYIYSLGYPELRKEKPLKAHINRYGYLQVCLSKNKKIKTIYVHRLVAQTFIPNPNNLPCVNHKDEDKTNNRVENLEWCTHKYNNNYGTRKQRIQKNRPHRKAGKIVLQYDLQGNFIKEWESVTEVHRVLNYSIAHISECCLNKRACYHKYLWAFKENCNVTNK